MKKCEWKVRQFPIVLGFRGLLFVCLILEEIVNRNYNGAIDVVVINEYLTFIEGVMLDFRDISLEMDGLELSHFDANGKITKYKEKLDHIIDTYDKGEKYLPLIHAVLGDGSDKFYFLGTQTTAEIRASGGFPGSVGSLSIENGI